MSFVAKRRKWSNYSQIDAMHYNLITFIGLRCFECFATYLNILDCFDVKSMQSIVIWSLSSFRDVTQKFWSFRRQIDAMHYNLITFVVLRQNSKVWSLRRQIDAMHYNLITFIGLRCFECFAKYLNILEWFDVKSMQSIVIWLLL